MYLKARTRLACQIAHLHPDRFNEAIHAGSFLCAPKTRPGMARVFDVNDIIVLRVYSWLIEEGMIPSKAGPMACGLRDVLDRSPEADVALCVKTHFPGDDWLTPEELGADAEFHHGTDIVSIREWRLKNLRARIEHELRSEASIVGDA